MVDVIQMPFVHMKLKRMQWYAYAKQAIQIRVSIQLWSAQVFLAHQSQIQLID